MGLGVPGISSFFLKVNPNVIVSDLLGAIWRLRNLKLLRIDQGKEEANSPLKNLDDGSPSSEENIQCFGMNRLVNKNDLSIVLIAKVSIVYVLAWS